MADADPKAARTALQALGISPGARLLSTTDLTLTLLPREDGLAPKDIPVDQLLHKVTMMRDKLRVLEQRVNAADDVPTAERASLQAHITAVQASFVSLVAFFSAEALPVVESTGLPATTPTTTTTPAGAAVPAGPAVPLGKTITRTPT